MQNHDRLARRAIKKYGANDKLELRIRNSAIVARTLRVLLQNWMSAYRPFTTDRKTGRQRRRHPSAVKQDLAIALAIRANDYHNGKPLSGHKLELMHTGLTRSNVRTSLAHLQAVGMVCKRKNDGYIIDPDYIVRTVDEPTFRRMVQAIIGGGKKLAA